MNKSILIQQVYPGLGFEPMLRLTQAHHRAYCDLHGIVYQPVFDKVFEHDPLLGSFAKIELIQKTMNNGYNEIVWLDADTLIVDTSVNLCKGVPRFGIGACWHRIPQLNHWNVGALYIDACNATKEFVNEWRGVYPPPRDGWNEQGVFNRLALQSKTVVTLSDKWNATLDVSMVPDAVVLGFHGQGNAEYRYKLMKQTMDKLFPKVEAVQMVSEVVNG